MVDTDCVLDVLDRVARTAADRVYGGLATPAEMALAWSVVIHGFRLVQPGGPAPGFDLTVCDELEVLAFMQSEYTPAYTTFVRSAQMSFSPFVQAEDSRVRDSASSNSLRGSLLDQAMTLSGTSMRQPTTPKRVAALAVESAIELALRAGHQWNPSEAYLAAVTTIEHGDDTAVDAAWRSIKCEIVPLVVPFRIQHFVRLGVEKRLSSFSGAVIDEACLFLALALGGDAADFRRAWGLV